MNRYILILPLFISLTMFSQETNNDVVEDIPTKLEQLIIDIESEIDIENFSISISDSISIINCSSFVGISSTRSLFVSLSLIHI